MAAISRTILFLAIIGMSLVTVAAIAASPSNGKAPAVLSPTVQLQQYLVTLLKDDEVAFRVKAARKLGEYQMVSAGDALIEALHDPEPQVRDAAAQTIEVKRMGLRP
jgi:HEAT repeat protein